MKLEIVVDSRSNDNWIALLKDGKLIEVLKQMIIKDSNKKDSAIKIAERLMKSKKPSNSY